MVTIRGNYSMSEVMSFIRQDLRWDVQKQPIAFNQDGPGWACKNTMNHTGYPFCFNSGTVYWRRGFVAQKVLHTWWHLAGEVSTSTRCAFLKERDVLFL